MLRKLTENLLTIIVTVALVAVAGFLMITHATKEQNAALLPLREQNESLRAQADENRRQLEATNQILRDAISHRQGEVFETDNEVQKINGARMDALADAIANRVAPKLPAPATPEEMARQQDQTVDRISSRTVEKLQPSIVELNDKQQLSQHELAATRVRLDQVTANLNQTQAAADDAIKLSHELSAMYLDTYKDHGVVIRLLALPAEVIRDAASGNVINDRNRKKEQQQLDAKLQEIEARLNQVRTQNPPLASNP
jgi:hypothetical protein